LFVCRAIQRGATAQNFAVEEVPAEAQASLDSESLEEAYVLCPTATLVWSVTQIPDSIVLC
jgi:hypothetical protein